MDFSALGLSNTLQKKLQDNNYLNPTPILQEKVIPLVLEHHDVMAQAQTGTGKSAAFVLPILELLSQNPYEEKRKIKVLVLAPTPELKYLPTKTSKPSFLGYLSSKDFGHHF